MNDTYVIENGAEVQLKHRDDVVVPDRIELLPGGFVKLIYKRQYQKDIYPREQIEGMYTHTSGKEENAEWW